jgi:hypothetical protein
MHQLRVVDNFFLFSSIHIAMYTSFQDQNDKVASMLKNYNYIHVHEICNATLDARSLHLDWHFYISLESNAFFHMK